MFPLGVYQPPFYATNDSDMVIQSMSIATADVPYVTEGPKVQYEAQADKKVRIRQGRLCEAYREVGQVHVQAARKT
jgi:hypothetical protein